MYYVWNSQKLYLQAIQLETDLREQLTEQTEDNMPAKAIQNINDLTMWQWSKQQTELAQQKLDQQKALVGYLNRLKAIVNQVQQDTDIKSAMKNKFERLLDQDGNIALEDLKALSDIEKTLKQNKSSLSEAISRLGIHQSRAEIPQQPQHGQSNERFNHFVL